MIKKNVYFYFLQQKKITGGILMITVLRECNLFNKSAPLRTIHSKKMNWRMIDCWAIKACHDLSQSSRNYFNIFLFRFSLFKSIVWKMLFFFDFFDAIVGFCDNEMCGENKKHTKTCLCTSVLLLSAFLNQLKKLNKL